MPMMPMDAISMPPTAQIEATMLVQPGSGLPVAHLMIVQKITPDAVAEKKTPSQKISHRGMDEKDTIALTSRFSFLPRL